MAQVKASDCLIKNRTISDIEFTCKYRTTNEMVLSEVDKDSLTLQKYDKLREKYDDLLYFTFSIITKEKEEVINQKGKENYFKMLDYVSNEMQNDFYVIYGKDTLPCLLYYYERNFELTPVNNINIGFQRKPGTEKGIDQLENDVVLLYDDKLLGIGPVNFKFEKESINELPILDYEKN